MWKEVVAARALGGHRLLVTFEDGVEGEISLRDLLSFEGIFQPLADQEYFEEVRVTQELGIVQWPNGTDLDSLVLYHKVIGKPIPGFSQPKPVQG